MGLKRFLRLAFYADRKSADMLGSWEKGMDDICRYGLKVIFIGACMIDREHPGSQSNSFRADRYTIRLAREKRRDVR